MATLAPTQVDLRSMGDGSHCQSRCSKFRVDALFSMSVRCFRARGKSLLPTTRCCSTLPSNRTESQTASPSTAAAIYPAELVESGVGAKLSDLLGQRSYRGSGD